MKTALILMMLIVNSYPGRVVKDTYVRLPNGNPTEQELYTAIAAAWGEKAEWVGKNHAGLHHLEVLTPEGELIELSFTRLPNRDEWEKRAGYVMMGTARVGEESYYFQAVVAIQIPDVKVFIYE